MAPVPGGRPAVMLDVVVRGAPAQCLCRFEVSQDTVTYVAGGGALVRRTREGHWSLGLGPGLVVVRPLPDGAPSMEWTDLPGPLALATSGAEPGPGALDVLGDALLERGHPLGARLRGVPQGGTDATWLAHLVGTLATGVIDVTWDRGLVSSLTLRGLREPRELLTGLSRHVTTHLVREIDVVGFGLSLRAPEVVIDALARQELPWLTRVTFHHLERREARAVEARRGPWGPARLVRFHAAPRARLAVEGPHGVEPVDEGGRSVMLAPLNRPAILGAFPTATSFVRHFQGAPVLSVGADVDLRLNGIPRSGPGTPTWLIPLMAGDELDLGGQRFRLVRAGGA